MTVKEEDDAASGKPGPGSGPDRLANLIRTGGALTGFDWPKSIREYEISIRKDGVWTHKGTPIERLALVRLFATVLRRDPEGLYWLAVPGERGVVDVEDAPFLAIEVKSEGTGSDQVLSFRTNLDHWVIAGPDNPIWVLESDETGEPSPYVLFRDGLAARIVRAVFYHLADLVEDHENQLGVWSSGRFFPLSERKKTDQMKDL